MRLEFETNEKLRQYLDASNDLSGAVFQGIDLNPLREQLLNSDLRHTVFLGCKLPPEQLAAGNKYAELLSIHDEGDAVVDAIESYHSSRAT